jgi:translocator protein
VRRSERETKRGQEMETIRKGDIPKAFLSIIACQCAGILGSIFTRGSVSTWYPTLLKPWYTPPGWAISAVWLLLFTLMGLSLFLVWRAGLGRPEVKIAVYVFAAQLGANVLWSAAFFGLKSPLAAFGIIVVLWILILLTIISFRPISRGASLLLVPYIIWVSFAAFLNYSIIRLNP